MILLVLDCYGKISDMIDIFLHTVSITTILNGKTKSHVENFISSDKC